MTQSFSRALLASLFAAAALSEIIGSAGRLYAV